MNPTKKYFNSIFFQTQEEMDEQDKVIRELEWALNAKINPLKLAETRLENRKMRPHMDLCADVPMEGLIAEVAAIKDSMQLLHDKLDHARYNTLHIIFESNISYYLHLRLAENFWQSCKFVRTNWKRITNVKVKLWVWTPIAWEFVKSCLAMNPRSKINVTKIWNWLERWGTLHVIWKTQLWLNENNTANQNWRRRTPEYAHHHKIKVIHTLLLISLATLYNKIAKCSLMRDFE